MSDNAGNKWGVVTTQMSKRKQDGNMVIIQQNTDLIRAALNGMAIYAATKTSRTDV
jgi:hypothetical protein